MNASEEYREQEKKKYLEYWKNKTQWIDSEPKLKLNLLPMYSEINSLEEHYKQQDSIREIMELNMVLYGKW